MSSAIAHTLRGLPTGARLLAFRLLYGAGVVVVFYVAAAIGQARHAGWIAAPLGLLAATATAFAIREPPRAFLSAAAPLRPVAPMRLAVLLPAAALLFVLVVAPLLLTRLPPFDDYANHLARMYVIARHGADPLVAKYYAIEWKIVPNLGMEFVVPWLTGVVGIYTAGTLFLVLCILLLVVGPQAIHATLYRRLSPGPLVALLFVYNSITKYGTVNYEFGTGLALFAIAGWIALRGRGALARGAFSLACVLVLFFCHLVALAIYGLAIGSFEVWRMWAQPHGNRQRAIAAAALLLPFAVTPALLLLGPHAVAPGALPVWGGLHARLDGIRYIFQTYDPTLDLAALAAMVAGFVWAVRRRVVALHPFGWILLVVAIVAYLVMPNEGMGSWGAAVRLPLGVLFVLIGAMQLNLPSAPAQRAFLVALAVLALLRFAAVEPAFRRYDRIRADLDASLRLVPPGSRILLAEDYRHDKESLSAVREVPLIAVIDRSCMVSTAYSHPLEQILVVRPPYRASAGGYGDLPISLPELVAPSRAAPVPPSAGFAFAPSGRIYWADWPHSYDYVYLLNPGRHAPNPAPGRLDLLYDGDRFQLFRVRRG